MFVQLYSKLQPANAEPLAVEALAGHLASTLPEWTYEIRLVDHSSHGAGIDDLVERVADARPRFVAISAPQGTLELLRQLLASLASMAIGDYSPHVILGHAIPTYLPEKVLKLYTKAIVVRGWGEEALIDLLRLPEISSTTLASVRGISYNGKGGVVHCADRVPREDGRRAAPPVRVGEPDAFFRRIEASRGCHYGLCTFCSRPPGPRRQWHGLHLAAVDADLGNLERLGVRRFTFTDEDLFGDDPEHVRGIVRLLRQRSPMEFTASMRVDSILLDDWKVNGPRSAARVEILRSLMEVGLRVLFLGVESLVDSQLRRYGKHTSVELSIAAVRAAADLGLDVEVGYIPFDPLATLDELRESTAALLDSGLASLVGTPFSWARLQVGSPLANSGRVRPLRGALDADRLEYSWRFESDEVASLFRAVRMWWDPIDYLYLLARNVRRSVDSGTPRMKALESSLTQIKVASLEWLYRELTVESRERGSVEPPSLSSFFDEIARFCQSRAIDAGAIQYLREYERVVDLGGGSPIALG